ncbi:hypothetical protein O9G_004842 [Rozella allomycis CSF55]|uniref:Uncharacterized protein n=1 Tax=Rozella allomycis (strain CSF55) TaxID=988480 RepID=A0A075AX17_ROZAC|nr:hypothetical protein O9G_004842 [Rozella allomycis CSF55]|eukprot:EPZ34674.1 hypothetical protein O9G_004842 [Rozella allomycis CSF55]
MLSSTSLALGISANKSSIKKLSITHFYSHFACEYGFTESLYLMMKDGKNIRCNQTFFLVDNSILPDPSTKGNYAIRLASRNGHADIVKYLLSQERVDPSALDNEAIRFVSWKGHVEVVKLLLADSRVDPGAHYSHAIRNASADGHLLNFYLQILELIQIINHKCGKLLNIDICMDILKRNNEKLVDFLRVLEGKCISQKTVNNAFLIACEYGFRESLGLMMQDRNRIQYNQKIFVVENRIFPDPSTEGNHAIRLASQNGHVEIVKYLLAQEIVDPGADDNYAVQLACENGHIEVVKLLLLDSRVDPGAYDNYAIVDPGALENEAIRYASQNGRIEVVKLLLADSRVDPIDPGVDDNYAIRMASKNGHIEVVRMLLADPRVDPSEDKNRAIRHAFEEGHLKIVQILAKDPRVVPITLNN